jgi:hypothetical protein
VAVAAGWLRILNSSNTAGLLETDGLIVGWPPEEENERIEKKVLASDLLRPCLTLRAFDCC